ncbi:tRNA 2-selenouridine(34) synthase MnmH [Robertmurraya sp. FSL W8-0741]|uniref:tRNA 2-selenouridine(34) synthase MnmH n=1 Tax=Robertmurraya sp. FSL W8-0741 TaxID=2954629 RepID=UPI0030F9E5FC
MEAITMNYDRTVEEFLNHQEIYIPVDVRSPGEFQDSRIPNAINVPLFTDEERSEIGTLYKHEGQKAAKWRAMELVSPKLPSLLEEIREIEKTNRKPLLYCWRGGMRSQSIAHFAMMSGLHIQRLEGGYRAYREYIVDRIPTMLPKQAVVIYGLTGTGKTEILHRLKEFGYPVLDLEGYANHKGSVFGAIDGHQPYNQKMFDALLFEDLQCIANSPYFFMEGESKRIGHAVQPQELYEKKENGIHIRIVSDLQSRVERIYEQYVEETDAFHARVEYALGRIIKRIKPEEIQKKIQHCLAEKNYREMIQLLIVHYYDPRYDNKINESLNTALEVQFESPEKAAKQIMDFIEERFASHPKSLV